MTFQDASNLTRDEVAARFTQRCREWRNRRPRREESLSPDEGDVFDGAAKTIRLSGPTVAIASYHRPLDLFDLLLRLSDMREDYRSYLHSHGDAGIDLVCYAVRAPVAVL